MKIESAEIRNIHHVPELYINGENVPAMMFGLSDIAGSRTNTHYA